MILRLLPSAREDLAEGFAFYERHESGVGHHFLESLFVDIDSLAVTAGIHRKVFGFHRLLSAKFPYAIYYLHNGKEAEIWAILDCRRDPKFLQRILKSRSIG